MTKFFSYKRLKQLRAFWKQRQKAGFTLTELLVSIIIGALITLALLSLVVQLTSANQRDTAFSQVQQDMQAALDYIAQDMREAVFVYNGECLYGSDTPPTDNTNFATKCPGVLNYVPEEVSSGGKIPVLAFWRTDPFPQKITDLCNTNAGQLSQPDNIMDAAGVSCTSGVSYSLVVYSVDPTPSDLWQGKARIVRYKLSQFPDNPTDQRNQSTGFANPLKSAGFTFQQWPLKLEGTSVVNRQTTAPSDPKDVDVINRGRPVISENPLQVLVDFVDNRGAIVGDANDNFTNYVIPTKCDEFGSDDPTRATALSPPNPNNKNPNNIYSFYACVRGGGVGNAALTGQNQDVQLTLVGSVSGQSQYFTTQNAADESKGRLSPIQTRVLIRGAIDKK